MEGRAAAKDVVSPDYVFQRRVGGLQSHSRSNGDASRRSLSELKSLMNPPKEIDGTRLSAWVSRDEDAISVPSSLSPHPHYPQQASHTSFTSNAIRTPNPRSHKARHGRMRTLCSGVSCVCVCVNGQWGFTQHTPGPASTKQPPKQRPAALHCITIISRSTPVATYLSYS